MALIAMAVYDTEENQRTQYTKQTLDCLVETVDLSVHKLIVTNNGSCSDTATLLSDYYVKHRIQFIPFIGNQGTAKGINAAWKYRKPKQHLIKIDNDVDILSVGWVDEMEEAIERDKSIGILGLKRKDLLENPTRNDQFKSTLRMLPHLKGERWIIVEDVEHVMGTCQMYNYRLIDKIGGLMQPGLYGFDDTLAGVRCKLAGFKNSFLPHIEIDHIDTKETSYWQEKRNIAAKDMAEFNLMKSKLLTGELSLRVEL